MANWKNAEHAKTAKSAKADQWDASKITTNTNHLQKYFKTNMVASHINNQKSSEMTPKIMRKTAYVTAQNIINKSLSSNKINLNLY